MKINAISTRLLLASALMLPLFLGVSGFFLLKAFENSLKEAENARLRGHIYLLFSVAELTENGEPRMQMPASLFEPDFERLNSGLYAYIYDREGHLVWRSNSSVLIQPPANEDFAGHQATGRLITQTLLLNKPLFSAHYDVVWEDSLGNGHPYRFAVTHERSNFNAELRAYRTQLWRWLGALAVLLLVAQAAILHWGLRPLGRLAAALKAMQSGETQNIAGEHPRELQKIVDNLNQVLAREKSLRQRYRNSLADLAHSLKTPLAVLQGKLDGNTTAVEFEETLNEQLTRMNQVVTYQLQRAVSDQQRGLTQRTRVRQVVERLVAALQKVYRDKAITVAIQVAPGTLFAGDEQDLMELLGNLLDNAFKYSRHHVRVEARHQAQSLDIRISDDGAGVPEIARQQILQRGQRLDTNMPGQGIGLAVVMDIISSYDGTLQISNSNLGGAAFDISLPLANPL